MQNKISLEKVNILFWIMLFKDLRVHKVCDVIKQNQ